MIYLLYGSDTGRSRQKLNEIVEEYCRKTGSDLNLYRFDAEEEQNEHKIRGVLETSSLFSDKKLVVVKYLFESRWGRDNFYKLLGVVKNDPNTVLIIWDRELSKKDAEEIIPFCTKTQEFKELKGEEYGSSVFRLGDTFFSSPREGLHELLRLFNFGHDDFNLFSYLTNHVRTLLIVRHYLEDQKSVPLKHGIHPFVVKKTSAIVRTLSLVFLYRAFHRFFEDDHKVKTGVIKPKDSLISMLVSRDLFEIDGG